MYIYLGIQQMKTLKICLVILCLLPFRAVGFPQFSGANLFMKEIKLYHRKNATHKMVAIVDDADYEYLNQFNWSRLVGRNTFYAHRKDKITGDTVLMHREILGTTDPKLVVDHKDKNGLNNTRVNIRACTYSQNSGNHFRSYGTSKYHGVSRHSRNRNKWVATITKNYKAKCLGWFDTEEQAALAYNNAAIEVHGQFANINLI